MEKLGVIGGMGAEATSYYYDQVVRHTAAACDQEHIDMVVLCRPCPTARWPLRPASMPSCWRP